MVTLGTKETDVLADDWTVVTADGSRSAHFEHTFTLTPDGAWVLTALDGGEAAAHGARGAVRWTLSRLMCLGGSLFVGRTCRDPA